MCKGVSELRALQPDDQLALIGSTYFCGPAVPPPPVTNTKGKRARNKFRRNQSVDVKAPLVTFDTLTEFPEVPKQLYDCIIVMQTTPISPELFDSLVSNLDPAKGFIMVQTINVDPDDIGWDIPASHELRCFSELDIRDEADADSESGPAVFVVCSRSMPLPTETYWNQVMQDSDHFFSPDPVALGAAQASPVLRSVQIDCFHRTCLLRLAVSSVDHHSD